MDPLGGRRELDAGRWGYFVDDDEDVAIPVLLHQDSEILGLPTQLGLDPLHDARAPAAGALLREDKNLMARLFVVEGLELESPTAVAKEDGNRFRIDWNWKW